MRPLPHPDELAAHAELRPHSDRAALLVADRVADAQAHAAIGKHRTAAARLDELSHALGGPDGLIGAARAAFLQRALSRHEKPGDEGSEDAVRAARIGGREAPGARVAAAIAAAKRGLRLETNAGAVTHESLVPWASRHVRAIETAARGELSDSQMGIYNAVYQIATGGIDGADRV